MILKKILHIMGNSPLFQLFSSRLFIQISTILQSIIIARILGPEGKGYFTEITIYPTLIASFAMFGLYTGIVKLAAKKQINEHLNITKTILKSTFTVGVIGALLALCVNVIAFKNNDRILFAAMIYATYVIVYCVNRGLSAYNNGRQNFKLFSISSVILYPAYFIILCILLVLDRITVTSCVIALLLANMVSCIFLYVKNEDKYDDRQSFPAGKLFKYSLKFSLADFSEPVYLYFDKAMLAITLSAYDLGIYTIAVSSAGLINLCSNTFSIKLFSDVANKHTSNIAKYIRINILLMSTLALVLCCILPFLIPMFYGREYSSSIIPAMIALATCIVQGQSFILERSVLAAGEPYVGVLAKVIGMIVFATALFCFKYLWMINVIIASVSAFVTSIFYFMFMNVKSKKVLNINNSLLPRREDFRDIFRSIKRTIKCF